MVNLYKYILLSKDYQNDVKCTKVNNKKSTNPVKCISIF